MSGSACAGIPRFRPRVRLGGDQFLDPDQLIGDEVRQEPCTSTGNAAVLGLAHRAVLLAPAEDAFDLLAALLRQAITCEAWGAAIDSLLRGLPVLAGPWFCATCGVTSMARRVST